MNTKQNQMHWVLAGVVTLLVLVVTILVVQPALSFAELSANQGRVGHDPLTQEEIEGSIEAVIADFKGAERYEILLSERHVETKAARGNGIWRRRSDVYVYSYDRDALKHFIINLGTMSIDSVNERQDIQLPLVPSELDNALNIAYENVEFRSVLDQAYLEITGEELTDLSALQVKAFIFRSDSMPDNVNELARNCGIRRCAQLLFYTLDDIAIEMQPIVDLSEGKVAQFIVPDFGDGSNN